MSEEPNKFRSINFVWRHTHSEWVIVTWKSSFLFLFFLVKIPQHPLTAVFRCLVLSLSLSFTHDNDYAHNNRKSMVFVSYMVMMMMSSRSLLKSHSFSSWVNLRLQLTSSLSSSVCNHLCWILICIHNEQLLPWKFTQLPW